MSFLARRVAATEGAYFHETSKQAVTRLREKAAGKSAPITASPSPSLSITEEEANADVLPEILQHSLSRARFQEDLQHYCLPSQFLPSPLSLAASLSSPSPTPRLPPHAYHVNLDTTGLYAFLPNLPQASFGPRRWKPVQEEVKLVASTANQARVEGSSTMDEARAKALMEGYFVVMKAFLFGTALVVGGSSLAAGMMVSKLEIHTMEDLRAKGHEHIQPWAKAIGQRFEPWRPWVHQQDKRWHVGDHHGTAASSFAQVLGLRPSAHKEEFKQRSVTREQP